MCRRHAPLNTSGSVGNRRGNRSEEVVTTSVIDIDKVVNAVGGESVAISRFLCAVVCDIGT